MSAQNERIMTEDRDAPTVLALDLEGTLISNAVSVFVRPGLFRFLTLCRPLFSRIVMFTTVRESRFREIARMLVDEGSAPAWFAEIEHVSWHGPTKDLAFVRDARVDHVLLVDDIEQYVHPGQGDRWVAITCFDPLFAESDAELERVLEELVSRIRTAGSASQG